MSHRDKNKRKARHRTHTVKSDSVAAPASVPAAAQPVAAVAASRNKRYRQNLSPEPTASPTGE
jgi:hypothetical protein